MKKSLLLILFGSVFLVGCASQSEVDDLQGQVYDLEGQVSDLQSQVDDLEYTIDECNSNIEDAQSYARSDYEDMGYALEELETCNY